MGRHRRVSNGFYALEKLCDGRTFLLDYAYTGQSSKVKQQVVEMALNGSGIRHTARVLQISTSTVIKELKKRNLKYSK